MFDEPTITVRENGATDEALPTVSLRPAGVSNVRTTVRGSRRMLSVSVSPPASVAVRRSSRCDGYSWSGAVNDPVACPAYDCSGWAWQFVSSKQWCMMSDQESDEAGSVPCCASDAAPEKEMTSPTAHRVVAAGERIVASGGVFPALIVTVSGVGGAARIGHPEPHGVVAGRVGERGASGGRVVELAVAVEVPGIGERVARVRVARPGPVEVDRERRGPLVGVAWRPRSAAGSR